MYFHHFHVSRQSCIPVTIFKGYDDWSFGLIWNSESSFLVQGTGDEIADMIEKEFVDITTAFQNRLLLLTIQEEDNAAYYLGENGKCGQGIVMYKRMYEH